MKLTCNPLSERRSGHADIAPSRLGSSYHLVSFTNELIFKDKK